MLFCVAKSYSKEGNLSFYPICVFESANYSEAHKQFLSMRFSMAGTFRLFELVSRNLKSDVCPCYHFGQFDSKKCLFTRDFHWNDSGDFISHSYFGWDPHNPKDGDPETIFYSLSFGRNPFEDNSNSVSSEVY